MSILFKIPERIKIKVINKLPGCTIDSIPDYTKCASYPDNLSYEVIIPVIPAADFLSYGRVALFKGCGMIHEQLVNNLLFALEAIYINGFRGYLSCGDYSNFTTASSYNLYNPATVREEGLKNTARVSKLSSIAWRPNISSENEVLGVYPDKCTICDRLLYRQQEKYGVATKYGDVHKFIELSTDIRTVSLPVIQEIPVKTDLSKIEEFYNDCDKEIYDWVVKMFSLLMLRYGEVAMAVKQTALVAKDVIKDEWTSKANDSVYRSDVNGYPFGDIAFVSRNKCMLKIYDALKDIPENAAVPVKEIWGGAVFGYVTRKTIQAHIDKYTVNDEQTEIIKDIELPGLTDEFTDVVKKSPEKPEKSEEAEIVGSEVHEESKTPSEPLIKATDDDTFEDMFADAFSDWTDNKRGATAPQENENDLDDILSQAFSEGEK